MAAPTGNDIAGGHDALITIPGIEGRIGIQDGIAVAKLDGSGLRTLALPSGSAIEGGWSWSPDGASVVAVGCRPCTYADPFQARFLPAGVVARNHVWIVPIDGSPVRELGDETRSVFLAPAWSSDGSVVAIHRVDCLSTGPVGNCTPNRGSEVLLRVSDGAITSLPLGGGEAAWSPDGARLAVSGDKQSTGGPGLFLMNADGTGAAKLADGGFDLHWSPDGQWLLFTRAGGLWIVSASGGNPRLIPGVSPWGGLDW
jgi:Tol biopolymer transport system component